MTGIEVQVDNAAKVHVDPFKKDCLESLRVNVTRHILTGAWEARGSVEFVNKNTKGEQTFKADTLEKVLQDIKLFLDTLE